MTLNQFVTKYNGKSVDFDHYFGFQCVDLIEFYLRDVFGSAPFYGNARDFYERFSTPLTKYFTRVPKGKVPKAGDIVIFSGATPGSGGYGHIAIVLSASTKDFVSLDQNWNGQYVHKVRHDYRYVLGYLAPKASAPKTTPPKAVAEYYTVRKNDNLIGIAARFKSTLAKILKLNPSIKNPNVIEVNQRVRVK